MLFRLIKFILFKKSKKNKILIEKIKQPNIDKTIKTFYFAV